MKIIFLFSLLFSFALTTVAQKTYTLHFPSAQYESKENEKTVDSICVYLHHKLVDSIAIVGHSDDVGSEKLNKLLSYKRANNTYELLKKCISKNTSCVVYGRGENWPLLPNTSAENRALNRRVELHIFIREKEKKIIEDSVVIKDTVKTDTAENVVCFNRVQKAIRITNKEKNKGVMKLYVSPKVIRDKSKYYFLDEKGKTQEKVVWQSEKKGFFKKKWKVYATVSIHPKEFYKIAQYRDVKCVVCEDTTQLGPFDTCFTNVPYPVKISIVKKVFLLNGGVKAKLYTKDFLTEKVYRRQYYLIDKKAKIIEPVEWKTEQTGAWWWKKTETVAIVSVDSIEDRIVVHFVKRRCSRPNPAIGRVEYQMVSAYDVLRHVQVKKIEGEQLLVNVRVPSSNINEEEEYFANFSAGGDSLKLKEVKWTLKKNYYYSQLELDPDGIEKGYTLYLRDIYKYSYEKYCPYPTRYGMGNCRGFCCGYANGSYIGTPSFEVGYIHPYLSNTPYVGVYLTRPRNLNIWRYGINTDMNWNIAFEAKYWQTLYSFSPGRIKMNYDYIDINSTGEKGNNKIFLGGELAYVYNKKAGDNAFAKAYFGVQLERSKGLFSGIELYVHAGADAILYNQNNSHRIYPAVRAAVNIPFSLFEKKRENEEDADDEDF